MQYVYDIMWKSALYLQHLPHIRVSFTLQPDHLASSDLLHHLGSYITRNEDVTIFQMSLLTALSCYALRETAHPVALSSKPHPFLRMRMIIHSAVHVLDRFHGRDVIFHAVVHVLGPFHGRDVIFHASSTFWAVFMDGNGRLMCFICFRELKWKF